MRPRPFSKRAAACLFAALIATGGTRWLVAQAPAPEGTGPLVRLPDAADFAQQVKEWTTRPEFLTPLVDHLPVVEGVPSPKDVLGYHIGAPKKLTRTADALRYYRALAAALEQAKAPRVKVLTIGKTDEGRELNIIVVGVGGVDPQPRHVPRRISGSWPTRDADRGAGARRIVASGQADLPPDGRPAQRRDRPARDADGAGLPPGGRGIRPAPPDPRAT